MTDRAESDVAPEVRRSRGARWLGLLALAILLLLVAAMGSVWWAARTEAGSAWLIGQLPGVQALAPRGVLLGDFEVQQLTVRPPGSADSVTLTGFGWTGLTLHPGSDGRWLRVGIDELHANRVDVALAPSAPASAAPRQAPGDLRLPIELELRALRVVELHATPLGDAPVRDLRAALHLGAAGGAEHRLESLSLGWDRLQASASGRVATAGAMPLDATLQLSQQAAESLPAWAANATLRGPLAGPHLQATVRAQPAAERPAQSLDASADLRPFAAWPLGELQASVAALDLSAFSSAVPTTALSGRAVAESSALDQPARVAIDLANAAAGRWNEQRLPVRRLTVELGARPGDLSTLDLRALDLDLGTQSASAGHVTGTGRWSAAGWTLEGQGRDLQPAGIDARAAPMRLNGPISLAGAGDSITLRTTLAGRWTDSGPARDATLALDARVSPLQIELKSARAEAGRARATLAGTVTRADAAAPWAVKGQAGLVDFDPAPWWPGAAASTWRRAATTVNAEAKFDLVVPDDIGSRPPATLLAALQGQADLKLDKSMLVGVPLEGSAHVRNRGGTAPAEATLRLDASGNRVQADGRIAITGNGAADAWTLAVDAAALDRLAPVLRLFAPAGTDATLTGSLKAQARVTGRWPSVASQGQLDARALRFGPASVRLAEARWQLGTAAGATIDADATLADAALAGAAGPGPSLDSLKLRLQGTGRAHTLDVQAASKALPPAWTDVLQPGVAPAPGTPSVTAGTLAHLQAQGGFIETAASAWSGWRGQLQQIDLRSSASTAPLLAARDVALEALWSGGPTRVSVQPGRADLLGGSVRWSAITWAAAGADGKPGRIDARVDIDPLRFAPLLARAQPAFGWGGDLALGGHVVLRSAPTFSADIAIERSGGDLTVTDELGTQALGITQLRLGLIAADGVWTFTPALAGRTVGIATGAVVVRASPAALWPGPDAPLQGSLQLDIASLGTLAPWLPAGWRADGALRASARVGGRFGAPEYTGEVTGSQLALRNFLQGVNIGNGELRVALRGDTAHIDRFTATAGTGTLGIEGDAVLGAAPRADLRVTASRFQVLGRADRRIVASGDARLRLDSKTVALDGRVDIDEGLIDVSRSDAPALSEDVRVVRARGVLSPAAAEAAATATPVPPVPGRNVAINLRVTMGDKLHVRGHGLDAGLRGELRVTSPEGRLAVNGSISTADGTYQAYGQKLTIDRGVITFIGPVDNPLLDIEATRPGLDIRVGVAVSGPTSNPRVRLFSEPDLSEIDKLSWLVMGKASDGLGRTDTALLQRAALALVSGEGPGTTDKLIKSIGLDELSVGQQANGDVKETVVSLGKQLSSRWFVGYERGLNATAGSWQLIYRLAQRLTVRAQAGGDSSLDLIWSWRWQ